MMAGGGRGGLAPSSIHEGASLFGNGHLNDVRLFLNSNATKLSTYNYSMNSADKSRINIDDTNVLSIGKRPTKDDPNLVTSQRSQVFNDETSSTDIFVNKKRGKTKKKSTTSTISSNTSSSYSSSSGVESMTAGIPGDCNAMSDKDKCHDICATEDHSKETMYAVGQWLRFLQMDGYLQDFIDNGYDDLETVKQIGEEDLDAIGVTNKHHVAFILDAVRVLKEQGAVWVYLLQAKENQEFHSPNNIDPHYNHIDSMLNHSGSSGETNGDGCLVGSLNGGSNSYPSSANSSVLPWCSNGAESNFQVSKLQEKSHSPSPNSNVERERGNPKNSFIIQEKSYTPEVDHIQRIHNDNTARCSSVTHNTEQSMQFRDFPVSDHLLINDVETTMSHSRPSVGSGRCQNSGGHTLRLSTERGNAGFISSPANIAHKDHNAAKYSSSQNSSLRTEDENLIQKVSDVMKMEKCDKLIKTPADNGHNTSSSTSSNRSQKSSESSNSFYASIPNSLASNQPVCNPVISLMLSNNQPPLQLHNRVYSGLQTANISELNKDKLLMLDKLKRRDNGLPQIQPTYANFVAASMANGTRQETVRAVADERHGYSPGIYASSSCLSDREEEDLYDFAAKYEGGRAFQFGRYNFAGSGKAKISPSGWYRTAKKLIHAKNSSKDDLSLIERPSEWQGYKSDLGSRIGSPLLFRNSNDIDMRFSTRTRLRPGGPLSSAVRSPIISSKPNRNYIATLRNGSLPSVTMSEFEEIGMKTMQGMGHDNQGANGILHYYDGRNPNYHLQDDLYQLSSRTGVNRVRMGRHVQSPATPLVKMRTNTKDTGGVNGDGCASPRVQMYPTRVVYSDRDANTTAGIITTSTNDPLCMMGSRPNFNGPSKKIPEAAV